MYKFIIQVFHVELFGCSSDVAVLVPISLLVAIDARDANVRPDIKLSLLIEERHDVLLDYVSSWSSHLVDSISFDNDFYFLQCLHYFDACSSVCVFSWLHQPCVSFLRLEAMLELLVFLLFILFFEVVSSFLELLLKFQVLFVVEVSHMECHGNKFKRICLLSIVVVFQVHKKGFFVRQVPIVGEMVMNSEVVWPVLVIFYFVSWYFSFNFTLLFNDFQLFQLLQLTVGKDFPIIIINRPHLRVDQCFLFLPFPFHLYFILNVLSQIRQGLWHWGKFLIAHSFCPRRTSLRKDKFSRWFYVFLCNALASKLRFRTGLLWNLLFLLSFLLWLWLIDIVFAVFEVWLWLDVFFEIIEDLILSELEPKHVDCWISGVQLLDSPPGSCVSEYVLDEGAIVALAHI